MIVEQAGHYMLLSNGSHKVFNVQCDFRCSEKCRGVFRKQYKTIVRDREKNQGKDICLYCSRKIKQTGLNNPNAQCGYNRKYFAQIDSEIKAYILGLIASDGSITSNSISIALDKADQHLLKKVIAEFGVPLFDKKTLKGLSLSSVEMVEDVCSLLKIAPGAKSHKIRLPDLIDDSLKWAFVRGVFDGDGSVNAPGHSRSNPVCKITSSSPNFLKDIKSFVKIPCSLYSLNIEWSGMSALDFLGKLYDDATIYLPRKRDRYLDWGTWIPSLNGKCGHDEFFTYSMTHEDAIPPFKERISDSGYDLTVVEKVKEFGQVELWTTGIKIKPDIGWYFDLVPRSSLSKRGYILANLTGVIDRTYAGPILVALMKIDPSAADITPGERLVQIIPRPIIHVILEEVEELSDTERGAGGFGSTGK